MVLPYLKYTISDTPCREQRYERHAWAFYQLCLFLTYKAALAGVPVVLVDPAYTSQTCSRCRHCDPANRQSQASFVCRRCGFAAHADGNSATNIAVAARQAANGSSGTSLATSPSADHGDGSLDEQYLQIADVL